MTSNRTAKLLVTFVLLWVGFSLVGYWIGRLVFHNPQLERLATHGEAVYGYATSKEPENHATIKYTYTVDDREYTGTGGALDGNPPFENIQTGDELIVVYDPENPEQSILGYPQDKIVRNNTGVYFVTATFPVFPMAQIVVIYLAIQSYRRRIKEVQT